MLISYVPRYKELEGSQKELKRHVLKKRDKPIVRVNVLVNIVQFSKFNDFIVTNCL